jgi:muramoyltetrapeptide carboxypeptidase LdcA involved in peptidoglycan recycling
MHIDLEVSPPSSSTRKRPMGRDAAKAERKKAKLASHDYATKMHELSIEKILLFKESEAERKVQLNEMVNIEKVKVEEAREHCKVMIDLEKERLELDKKWL